MLLDFVVLGHRTDLFIERLRTFVLAGADHQRADTVGVEETGYNFGQGSHERPPN
jgi:hypothetical protein